jgi:hypothetical protein
VSLHVNAVVTEEPIAVCESESEVGNLSDSDVVIPYGLFTTYESECTSVSHSGGQEGADSINQVFGRVSHSYRSDWASN